MSDKKKTDKNSELSDAGKTLGHFGGLKGGPARDAALSHEEKSAIARKGGLAKSAKMKAALKSKRKKKSGGK